MRHHFLSHGNRGILLGLAVGVGLLVAGCAGTMPGKESEDVPADKFVYPAFDGMKKRLAVIGLENKVKTPVPNESWKIGEGLTEVLTTELFKTDRFIMVERKAIAEIVKEQELGQTGLLWKDTALKVGRLLGAQLLVSGAVTEFEAASKGGGGGLSFSGLALNFKTRTAHVAVDVRMVDASTGQILSSFDADGKAEQSALGFAAKIDDVTFGSDGFYKTPIGKATREAIHKAVMFIIKEMEEVPWSASVVKVKDGKVYVNAGTNVNLKPGASLAAYSKGEELIDPTTGLSLGSTESRTGTVTLEQVEEKFSIGTFIGTSGLKRGDVLKLKLE